MAVKRGVEVESTPNDQNHRRITRSMVASIKENNESPPVKSKTDRPLVSARLNEDIASGTLSKRRRKSTGKTSQFYKSPWMKRQKSDGSSTDITPGTVLTQTARQAGKPLSDKRFGLIQERYFDNLYALVVQAILWNQTTGKQARPVLEQMLAAYPTPEAMAAGRFEDLAHMLHPIGLYNNRAKRLLDMANMWVEKPPVPGRGYTKMRDRKYAAVPIVDIKSEEIEGTIVKPEISDEARERERATQDCFWEIAHLPGVGPYALDSFRIFHRDVMRGLAKDWLGTGAISDVEPEWKRVVPADKELRAYLKWQWAEEDWDWNWDNGHRTRLKCSQSNG